MAMILFIIFVSIIITLIDLKELLKINHKIWAAVVYFSLMFISLVVSILLVIDKPPVSPAVAIEKIICLLFGRS